MGNTSETKTTHKSRNPFTVSSLVWPVALSLRHSGHGASNGCQSCEWFLGLGLDGCSLIYLTCASGGIAGTSYEDIKDSWDPRWVEWQTLFYIGLMENKESEVVQCTVITGRLFPQIQNANQSNS